MVSYSNLVSILNNSISKKKKYIRINHSIKIIKFIHLLVKEKFLENYIINNNKTIYIYFKYYGSISVIKHIKNISKISKKSYIKSKSIKLEINRCFIISNSYGLMTSFTAKKLNQGGQIICEILC
jgi:ribosomal protein S8